MTRARLRVATNGVPGVESVACAVKKYVPVTAVPDKTPVDAFRLTPLPVMVRPVHPEVHAQVFGLTPFAVVRVAL